MKIIDTKKVGSKTVIMWSDPKVQGKQTIKFNTKEDVSEGDSLSCGSKESPVFYNIHGIKEKRPSTLEGWEYVTAVAERSTRPTAN